MNFFGLKALAAAIFAMPISIGGLSAQEASSTAAIVSVTETETSSFAFLIEDAGAYTISVPSIVNTVFMLDDAVLVSGADGSTSEISILTTLSAGTHVLSVSGENTSSQVFDDVTLRRASASEDIALSEFASTDAVEPLRSAASFGGSSNITDGMVAANDIRSVVYDALSIIDPEAVAVNFGDGAVSSMLMPPANVAMTQAIEIIGGASEDGLVAATGQTLFGRVFDNITYDIVEVDVSPSGRTATVEVGPENGGFAVRLFESDLTSGSAFVTVRAASSSDDSVTSDPVTYQYTAANLTDGLGITLSRITFGATPELYSRVRAMGYQAYIEEQLDPDSIDNRFFNSQGFEDFLVMTNGTINAENALHFNNLMHATFSELQLREVMGLFWSNHFHASNKMSGVIVQAYDDREFYRQNAFGRFEDLLLYSARSPLMSQFLDNDQSSYLFLNENYAREILELHTVGTDAGYGDEEIIEVSRIFTGWNYRHTNLGQGDDANFYEFEFKPEDHDPFDKYVAFLDATIEGREGAAGVQEGEELIALLAADPRTHEFVCGKIVQWFIADVPPQNFIDICTEAWLASDGNSGEILRALLLSPEFVNTPEIVRAKGKNPLEYSASFLRSTGAWLDDPTGTEARGRWARFTTAMTNSGYNPAAFDLPTGLDEIGTSWANTSVFVNMANAPSLIIDNRRNSGILIEEMMEENGMETAEELAAYLLTVATLDRFRQDEFDAVVSALKINGGPFSLDSVWTSRAIGRALTLVSTTPSFLLQ